MKRSNSPQSTPSRFTVHFTQEDGWWVGVVVEVPGVVSQGRTPEELMENLKSALDEALEIYRSEAEAAFEGRDVQEATLV